MFKNKNIDKNRKEMGINSLPFEERKGLLKKFQNTSAEESMLKDKIDKMSFKERNKMLKKFQEKNESHQKKKN